jgi:hypothetical protein
LFSEDWLEQVTFWEVNEAKARRWFDENHQPIPDELKGIESGPRAGTNSQPGYPASVPSGTEAPSVPTEGDRTGPSSGREPSPRGVRQPAAVMGNAWPQNLDSQAVGIAHEMLEQDGWINVSEVARRLDVERTKLYRHCPAFKAMVATDHQSNRDRQKRFHRGWKDRETGRVECADDD